MSHVSEDTYLGDLISNDGKNSKNIRDRIGKGHGKITEIMNMLEATPLGQDCNLTMRKFILKFYSYELRYLVWIKKRRSTAIRRFGSYSVAKNPENTIFCPCGRNLLRIGYYKHWHTNQGLEM